MSFSPLTTELLTRYTGASRTAGGTPLDASHAALLHSAGWPDDIPTSQWTMVDWARYVMLRDTASAMSAEAFEAAALACFREGDAREQTSWCRAVSLLPEPARFLPQLIEACRTNIVPLFESIACENPFLADFFPERNFNQVVLKAMFNSIALSRIVGLDRRRNSELARMANDYAAERTAAGRSVPADIDLAR